jgi:hypothetical protein
VIELLAGGDPWLFQDGMRSGASTEVGKCLDVMEIGRMSSSWNRLDTGTPTQRCKTARLVLVQLTETRSPPPQRRIHPRP